MGTCFFYRRRRGGLPGLFLAALALLRPPAIQGQDLRVYLPEPDLLEIFPQENYEARSSLRATIYAPLQSIPVHRSAVYKQREARQRVKFQTEATRDALYILFLNEEAGAFPIAGKGSMVIKRDRQDGRFIQVKVFLRSHPECYVRITPEGQSCLMDVVLYGIPLYQRIPLAERFADLCITPFNRVIQLTAGTVAWPLLLYEGRDPADRRNLEIVAEIRRRAADLREAADGAMDENGRFVAIATGLPLPAAGSGSGGSLARGSGDLSAAGGGFNCSGFAKWIVDGFVRPLLGMGLPIPPLKVKHLEARGNRWSERFEEERDPFFGLDWSRNLALKLQEARGRTGLNIEDADVRESAFLRYVEDIGYPLQELELLLFLDSQEHPGHFYLGSINRGTPGQPVLRQHHHLVVLLPYYDGQGVFLVKVFEIDRETSLKAVQKRFPEEHIHLVRLSSAGPFDPPPLR